MEINYLKDKRICEIWLTRTEQDSAAISEALNTLYKLNRDAGFLSVVYSSGESELYGSILDLLAYNKIKIAEADAQPKISESSHAISPTSK